MTDSMGPGKLVRHMQNPSYTYDKYLMCVVLGPSISSVICKNPSYSGPSYPSSPVYTLYDVCSVCLNHCSVRPTHTLRLLLDDKGKEHEQWAHINVGKPATSIGQVVSERMMGGPRQLVQISGLIPALLLQPARPGLLHVNHGWELGRRGPGLLCWHSQLNLY